VLLGDLITNEDVENYSNCFFNAQFYCILTMTFTRHCFGAPSTYA